ncbi:hypothetical protein D3C80_1736520 [compost metagenome]
MFDQASGMGERRQAHITARFELNLVDGKSEGGEVVALQAKRVARFDDKQPRPVHGHDLHQD